MPKSIIENIEKEPLARLFAHDDVFSIPTYQRGYAWGEEEVEDFLDDLEALFSELEETGTCRSHFFGGLVCTRKTIPGSSRNDYVLIDGQQRIATFTLLNSVIARAYDEISSGEGSEIAEERAKELKRQFVESRLEEDGVIREVSIVTLSGADDEYFQGILRGSRAKGSRDSHHRILSAAIQLDSYVAEKREGGEEDQLQALRLLQDAANLNCQFIRITASDEASAYQLFQVLNDRGIELAEGDLLRMKTLELTEKKLSKTEHGELAKTWDQILEEGAATTEHHLNWIYESNVPTQPSRRARVFEQLLEDFYDLDLKKPPTKAGAERVISRTEEVLRQTLIIRKLVEGDWPYENRDGSIRIFHTDRVYGLMRQLKHIRAVPLILAATKLSQKDFWKLVHYVELFFFRYKIVCNAHIGSATAIYRKHTESIRTAPSKYKIASLKKDLLALMDQKADEALFRQQLPSVVRYRKGGSNSVSLWFLETMNWYWTSLEAGSDPKATNPGTKLSPATIEHIYPQNDSSVSKKNASLARACNELGNLTLLTETENSDAGDKAFADKLATYAKSQSPMTRYLADHFTTWTVPKTQDWQTALLNHASRLFRIA